MLGGPLGRRAAAGRSWFTPERVLLVAAGLAGVLAVLAKQHCRQTAWASPGQFVHACYSDVPVLFRARGLADGLVPYLSDVPVDQAVEYPVLTGLVMWVTALLVPGEGATTERLVTYFDVNAVLLVACLLVTVVATARTVRHRPWDAAVVALSPAVVLAGTINWDLWAVALTSLALLAWSRDRPLLAGVLLGLATAAKFYPLLLLGPLLLLCWRAGRLGRSAQVALGGVAAWAAVNVPVALADPDGWARFYDLSRERGAGWSSLWLMWQHQLPSAPSGDALNTVALLAFVACCAAIAVLAVAAPRRPRLAALAFLVVAAFLLTNKVYSPQFVVWLVPLAALARPRWRDVLVWQACEAVHFAGVWLYFAGTAAGGDPDRGLPEGWYDLSVLVHVAGTLWMVALVVRDVLRPEHDPVRAAGDDDPGGGPLDGAPDVRTLGPATRPAGRRSRGARASGGTGGTGAVGGVGGSRSGSALEPLP